ncbi:MAG: ribose-phosphate pyrophosphokinase [Gammaproteobacteria bacterium GWE2_42_36]|nr:MAG: ribose-phosphate pyrophosphokinase [Gammaproteobacteria bacterium GWE2_42_36]
MMIFSGNSNRPLAEKVAQHLHIELGRAQVGRFSDGEIQVEILDNVRGKDVFIIQSTSAPSSDHLLELLFLADALRRASATRITAVVPYFGFARQDRRPRSARVPISAKVVADMMAAVGIERLVTVDLHADQIQGFFYMPVDNLYSTPIMLEDIRQKHSKKIMIISPDVGGVVRARALTKLLPGAELAIIDKRRPKPNEAEVMHVIGEVKDCDCIIIDDIVDTAGTMTLAANALKKHGAKSVIAYATHAVLSGKAIDNLENSSIDELIVADTIALSASAKRCKKIRELTISDILAKAIRCICESESISSMFN